MPLGLDVLPASRPPRSCSGLVGTALSALRPLSALRTLSLEGCRGVPLLDEGLASLPPGLSVLSLQGGRCMGGLVRGRLGKQPLHVDELCFLKEP